MNQTKQQAYEHMVQARFGSLAGDPSPVYLEKLLVEVRKWEAEIEQAYRVACQRYVDKAKALEESNEDAL
jgi:hypothetical protein